MEGQKMREPLTPPRYVSDDEDFPPSDDEEIEDDIPEAQTEAQTEAGIKDGTSLSVDEFKSLLSEIEAVVDDNEETWYKIFTGAFRAVLNKVGFRELVAFTSIPLAAAFLGRPPGGTLKMTTSFHM